MGRRVLLPATLLTLMLLARPASGAGLDYVWADPFSAAERDKLIAWVEETAAAVQSLVGPFPMPVRVYFHRRDDAREPVPWANTQRSRSQGVHFHVDPAYPLDALRRDWTAPHELSHLILPYLGRRHAWFAEGFASYLQYRVMQTMGVLSASAAERRYQRNFERAERGYAYPERPFADAATQLRAEGKYPVMYWGGAAFFRQVDGKLATRGTSLIAVLSEYLACCRRDRAELDDLLTRLDGLSGAPVFTATLTRFRSTPGFPEFRAPLPAAY